jgi:uncharacterized protein (DUF2147 family)
MKDGDSMSKLVLIAIIPLCSFLLVLTNALLARADPHAQAYDATTPPADAILGEWWTEGKEGRFRFVRTPDGTYAGILVGGNDPGVDVNNKDESLRKRPLLGSVLIWHLRPDDGEYVDGFVYNPRNGKTYRIKAELTGKTLLKIRGYVGISLFGQSQTWARAI